MTSNPEHPQAGTPVNGSADGRIVISVDAMGGEHAPAAIVAGAVRAVRARLPVILVGDQPYYTRFGFAAGLLDKVGMPGPVDYHRFLALEFTPGHIDGLEGVLSASGVLDPMAVPAAREDVFSVSQAI